MSNTLNRRLAKHIGSLLGFSLLPLHISILSGEGAVRYVLWGNHLVIATIWLFLLAPYRSTLYRLGYMIGAASLTSLAWGLPAGEVAWLVGLASTVICRIVLPPNEAFRYSLACLYLLTAAVMLVSMELQVPFLLEPDHPTVIFLHCMVAAAALSSVLPATDQQLEKPASSTEGLLYCGLLVTFAAALLTPLSFIGTEIIKTPAQVATLITMVAGLILLSRYQPPNGTTPSKNGSLREGQRTNFQHWALTTLQEAQTAGNIDTFLHNRIGLLTELFNGSGASWAILSHKGTHGSPATAETNLICCGAEALDASLTIVATPSDTAQRQAEFALAFLETLVELHQHQEKIETQKHLESIYETGARITHDVKNLLQSLNTLTTAVVHSKPEQATAIQSLIKKQLPLIREKLQITLDKLAAPDDVSTTFQVARIWWGKLQLRYEGRDIEFTQKLEVNHLIPRDLFEQVAENLLDNAQRKRQTENDISIHVHLEISHSRIALTVTDTGSAAADEITNTLFKTPVESTGGYGIALYQ